MITVDHLFDDQMIYSGLLLSLSSGESIGAKWLCRFNYFLYLCLYLSVCLSVVTGSTCHAINILALQGLIMRQLYFPGM